jgi:hypothetical protein
LKSQSNCEEKVNWGRHHNSSLQTILQSHENTNNMILSQKQEDPWIWIEDPDINPHIYIQLIFDKGYINRQWRKDSLLDKCCWEIWISTCRRMKLVPCL